MSDTIIAAFISGSIQALSASAAIFAAWVAFRSWRRQTLGNRQLALAEECLLLIWKIDASIKDARQTLFPVDLQAYSSNSRYKDIYEAQHKAAYEKIRGCLGMVNDLKHALLIAEIYMGELPRVKFNGETRFFKMGYKIDMEYDELIGGFPLFLRDVAPEAAANSGMDEKARDKIIKSADLYYGFAYEYEEDEYSVRLRLARQTFERYAKKFLRQRSFLGRAGGKIDDLISDTLHRKFKPTTINKHPYHEKLSEQIEAVKPVKII